MRRQERYRDLGRAIRKLRINKGIDTAQELSRLAGLARNYVSVLERGEYRPTWKTMAQIADALKLSPVERAGLFQRADLADKPAEVRESTAVPIPVASGITLWKHFPGLLFQVPHFCAPSCMVYPDVIFPELIRATGALLSWIALKINPPTGKTLACLQTGRAHV